MSFSPFTPMDLTRPPDWRDVEGLMRSGSYWPSNSAPQKQALARTQADTGAQSALEEFSRATGYKPFYIAPSAPMKTRVFDWDGDNVIQLGAGLVELGQVTLNGQVISSDAYRLWPSNARADDEPFNSLAWMPRYMQWWKSRARNYGPYTVEVTARWGYCTLFPADAWQNILQAAGLITLCQIENFQSIASLSQDGFSKAFDVVGILSQKDIADRWRKEFPACVERYKRVIL